MNLTAQPTPVSPALTCAATTLCRFGPLVALVAVALAIGLIRGGGPAAASDGPTADLPVGHSVKRVVVPGATQDEPRQVDVQLWYPADPQDFSARPKAGYSSALYGKPLPAGWAPLSWRFEAQTAREGAAVDPQGQPFPVIVFTHGSVNDPINYAHLLERVAAAGFVVAAPSHVTDTQEDVRIDFINEQARLLDPDRVLEPEERLFNCNDGLPPRTLPVAGGDCSKPNNTTAPPTPPSSPAEWPTAPAISRRSWMNCRSGSEPVPTCLAWASWATRAAPSPASRPRPAARRGTLRAIRA
jgi:Platelet-activating factor acetylhydrolase, isoform II